MFGLFYALFAGTGIAINEAKKTSRDMESRQNAIEKGKWEFCGHDGSSRSVKTGNKIVERLDEEGNTLYLDIKTREVYYKTLSYENRQKQAAIEKTKKYNDEKYLVEETELGKHEWITVHTILYGWTQRQCFRKYSNNFLYKGEDWQEGVGGALSDESGLDCGNIKGQVMKIEPFPKYKPYSKFQLGEDYKWYRGLIIHNKKLLEDPEAWAKVGITSKEKYYEYAKRIDALLTEMTLDEFRKYVEVELKKGGYEYEW